MEIITEVIGGNKGDDLFLLLVIANTIFYKENMLG